MLDLFRTIQNGERDPKDKSVIKGITGIPNDANICKVCSDGNSVYANKTFYTNDIIEICPVKVVSKSVLFDRDLRQIVFEVEKDTTYVIPFGYCQYYDMSSETAEEPNCDYIWDPNQNVIVITALHTIRKGSKLILNI